MYGDLPEEIARVMYYSNERDKIQIQAKKDFRNKILMSISMIIILLIIFKLGNMFYEYGWHWKY